MIAPPFKLFGFPIFWYGAYPVKVNERCALNLISTNIWGICNSKSTDGIIFYSNICHILWKKHWDLHWKGLRLTRMNNYLFLTNFSHKVPNIELITLTVIKSTNIVLIHRNLNMFCNLGFWCLTSLLTINWWKKPGYRRKPPNCRKSLTNFIT